MRNLDPGDPYMYGPRVDYTWSARFSLGEPCALDEVIDRLDGLMTDLSDAAQPLSAAVLGGGRARNRQTLVLGLDPSETVGTPTPPQCEALATAITKTLGWQRRPAKLPDLRITMGRCIGDHGQEYSMDQVHKLMIRRRCGDLALTRADLFSLRHDKLQEYPRPGVIVAATPRELIQLLGVAASMGQERLVAETTGVETQVYIENERCE